MMMMTGVVMMMIWWKGIAKKGNMNCSGFWRSIQDLSIGMDEQMSKLEVHARISRLQYGKVSGLDIISTDLLKVGGDSTVEPIVLPFNQVLATGKVLVRGRLRRSHASLKRVTIMTGRTIG